MGTDNPDIVGIVDSVKHPSVRRFLEMVARPDLRSEIPEQYQKHWENKGYSGNVQIVRCRIADHPCELTFSLFFNVDEVIQTGILIRFQGETLLNEVRKGDALDFMATKRIDPVVFLKQNYASAGSGTRLESPSFTLAVDDDSEEPLFRAVLQLTGKGADDMRSIWAELLATNSQRLGKDQASPIFKTWLRRERDRIDLQYLRFARLLLPRSQDVVHFASQGHTCIVAGKRMRGTHIRQMIDAVDPEWWGGMFFGLNQGALVRVPHDQKDRLLALKSFASSYEFPIEEIFIDNRHLYSVLFVGPEALVWRTRHQAVADMSIALPEVAATPAKGGVLSRLKERFTPSSGAAAPAGPPAEESPADEAPSPNAYWVARAENAYMTALRDKSADLKNVRKQYLQVLYDSDVGRFYRNPAELLIEVQGTLEQALAKDPVALQKEAALAEAHVTIFYEERE
jgi:hypothetical protein